jgi:anoctamin-10/anoctamin-7
MRRPWPRGAQDIGTWQAVFDIVIAAAVVTNAALIVFTMNLSGSDNTFTQFWIFIGFQWIVFVTQYVIRALIPDLPFEVEIQRDRADFMNRKLIMKEVEEDDSDLEALLAAGKQGDRPSQSIAQWDQKRIDALNVNGMIKEHIDD